MNKKKKKKHKDRNQTMAFAVLNMHAWPRRLLLFKVRFTEWFRQFAQFVRVALHRASYANEQDLPCPFSFIVSTAEGVEALEFWKSRSNKAKQNKTNNTKKKRDKYNKIKSKAQKIANEKQIIKNALKVSYGFSSFRFFFGLCRNVSGRNKGRKDSSGRPGWISYICIYIRILKLQHGIQLKYKMGCQPKRICK